MNKSETNQLRIRIVEAARERFFQFGFSAVTTEEIATDLGISKRTLYQHFRSKNDLLHEAVFGLLRENELILKGVLHDENIDFIGRLKFAVSIIIKVLSRFQRPFVRDVFRYAPDIAAKIIRFRQTKILSQFRSLFQSGIDEGLLRKDLDIDLVMVIFTQLIDSVVNPEVVSQLKYSTHEVFEAVINTFLIGILADDSRVRYEMQE